MKKTLIALTLAALPVASMAEVVLYGQIKGGVEVTKQRDIKGTVTNIVDYGSRIGFKGQEQLNDNLKAIWQLEQGVDIAGSKGRGFGTRDSFVGLQGNFGTVKAGYMHGPLAQVSSNLNVWDYSDNAAGLGVFNRSTDAVKRRVAVGYETPNLSGFTARAYVSPSDNNRRGALLTELNAEDLKGKTAADYLNLHSAKSGDLNFLSGGSDENASPDNAVYGLGASYENNGFFADVAGAYVRNGVSNGDWKDGGKKKKRPGFQAVAQVGYNANNVMLGLAYQHARNVDTVGNLHGIPDVVLLDEGRSKFDNKDGKIVEAVLFKPSEVKVGKVQEVAATAAYTFNDALTLKGSAAYGFNISQVNGEKFPSTMDRYVQGVVGADYKLSKRTQLNGQVGFLKFGKRLSESESVAPPAASPAAPAGTNASSSTPKAAVPAKGTVSIGLTHRF